MKTIKYNDFMKRIREENEKLNKESYDGVILIQPLYGKDEPKVGINWSGLGTVSTTRTRFFIDKLTKAKKIANEINREFEDYEIEL